MRFSPALLDEIRARLPISEVAGRRVTWDRRKSQPAKGDYWACCPFHSEKTPSFHVDDRRGIYKCFGCGASGDMFKFVTETEGLSFPEVVERLAGEAGVPLPVPDPRTAEREEKRANLHEVMELATAFFEAKLQSRDGAAARGYLAGRGIGPDLQARFRLGYAPNDRSALKTYLAGKGVSREQLIDTGLVVHGDDIPVPYDRFRDRVIFPITDLKGRVIAFGGRAMSADIPAKYLNSPETPLFHKSYVLYNGAGARRAAYNGQTVVAVEGYIDVIALVAAGFEAAVAPLGTALTSDQMTLLWRMSDEPVLCFDGDAAGMRAAARAVDTALPLLAPGKSLRFAMLPEGQDPDDVIRSAGRPAIEDILDHAHPLADMLWRREAEAGVYDTPERRAALEARLNEIVRTIRDDAVRRHYAQAIGERLQAAFGSRRPAEFRRNRGQAPGRDRRRYTPQPIAASTSLLNSPAVSRNFHIAISAREAVLLGAIINHPRLIAHHIEEIAELELGSRDLDRLRAAIVEIAADRHDIDASEFRGAIVARGFEELLHKIDGRIAACRDWYAAVDADDADAEQAWRQSLALHNRTRVLHKELRAAELSYANDPSEENWANLLDIRSELAKTEGTEALVEGFGERSGRPARTF
ncbi:MAG: DNA primase [Hyphomicrobiales bacterium]|nr:DNA primase [Hyphomicrobiales bacterium]